MIKTSKKNNVTVKEIARKAGVSVSTVSRVLSGTATAIPISEKTRQKVLDVCEEFKFLPDVNYTRLQLRRCHIIALMIPRNKSRKHEPFPFDESVGLFLSSLDSELSSRGYSVLIQGVDQDYVDNQHFLRILRNNSADGLIVWDAFLDDEPLKLLNEEHRPTICAAFPYENALNYIIPDNYQGAYDMTRYLIKLGHRRIAYISGGKGELVDNARERGYVKAMAEHNLETRSLTGGYTFDGGYECGDQLLARRRDITAIFAANDLMAIGAMERLKLEGLSIPGDVAIAGFDGSSHSAISTPRISTCKLPLKDIGRLSGSHIVDLIEEKRTAPVQMTLPVEIIKRESTEKG